MNIAGMESDEFPKPNGKRRGSECLPVFSAP